MALTPGTRLGPYEITAQIGEGGMGAVYRATDTSLGRQVAIKVLPDAFAADPDRVARFTREAKVLASLNHPHIAGIYGLETGLPGLPASPAFIVMELVEGDDLSQRIARLRAPGASARQAGMPLDEALPIAKQIAEALEAAHEQGIIHRDLKPANIKVRSDGTVKVLDFGLAKIMEPAAGSSPSISMSPTITTPAMTQAGMILGTAAYMSPEQAKGRPVDRRADIWAFGCVLFEMLTATRAFGAADVQDTLVAIMRDEPNWARLPSTVSPALGTYLKRCLQKDAKQRVQSIGDVRLALEGAFDSTVQQTTTTTSTASAGTLGWIAFAVAALGLVALAIPAVRYLRETPPPAPPETRTEIVTPPTDQPTSFALSPDGRQIVYLASRDGASRLWLRSLATTTAQPVPGTDGATHPFWSPDSRSIGFFAGGALKRIDLGVGAPLTLASSVVNGSGATWSSDGVIVFAPSQVTPLLRVSAAGGATVPVTTLDSQQTAHVAPTFLPDGRHFVFTVIGASATTGIYLGTLAGSTPVRLTEAVSAAVYLPDGWLLWVRSGTLVAQRLNLARSALSGEPVIVAAAVDAGGTGGGTGIAASGFSVAETGLVAYRTGGGNLRQLTWMQRSGAVAGTIGDADGTLNTPRLSVDGRHVVVSRAAQGNRDLWLLDGGRTSRLTFDASIDQFPVWSPDGARVAFRSGRSGSGDIYQKLTSGAGAEERVVASNQTKTPTSWSLDGRFLLYISNDQETSADLWVVPMSGDRTPSVFVKTPFRESWGMFSPDGRWVAYESNESGQNEIYIRSFAAPGTALPAMAAPSRQSQVSTAGGIHPAWRSDGKELYYLNPAGVLMATPISVNGSTVTPGAPVTLFATRVLGGGVDTAQGRQYDVAPDGRFLINTVIDSAATPITLIQNWNPDAKK